MVRLPLSAITYVLMLAVAPPLVAGAVSQSTARSDVAPVSLDLGEELPGGGATSAGRSDGRDAFTHASAGLSLENEQKFKLGNAIFRRLWVAAPSSTTSADGLGPLYNARSCQTCHVRDGRGQPPVEAGTSVPPSLVMRLSITPATDEDRQLVAEGRKLLVPEPRYGRQLQTAAIKGFEAEGRVRVSFRDLSVKLGDGEIVTLTAPTYAVDGLKYGALDPNVLMSPRLAPQLIGLGLLEAIPEEQILNRADPDDADGDGISGRASEVWSSEEQRLVLGRFGWKASTPSVRVQTAEAAAVDIGLSNPVLPDPAGDCTPAQAACKSARHGQSSQSGSLELPSELLDLLVYYAENLAVPARRDPSAAKVLQGKAAFGKIGCAQCHTPSHTTGAVAGQPQLSNQQIWPYTDLLLHDMGNDLADGRPEGLANGREWRTPPLWGIGLTDEVSGQTRFLHDGRARTIEEAILWHGGEAERARNAYAGLDRAERDALIAFVNSL